ncbi:MAG: AAA family ATPase [Bdellovibrionaceae bacterium]|nr:AAA family ATPase [Pseudobdellovibrionaceae bacterium]MCB9092918.1 AAA family ATPase [Halobacteriovoraceae bacterium]
MSESKQHDIGKNKIRKVFRYIQELTKLRTPPVSDIEKYPWVLKFSNLPLYPTVERFGYADSEESNESDNIVLKVRRPKETPCPNPPESIKDWVVGGWESLNSDAVSLDAKNIIDEEGKTQTVKFEDDQKRVNSFDEWKASRDEWVKAEYPVREASKVFSDLFKLQAQIQRESEKYQMYLADGHLVWPSAQGMVNHPILLKKVELEFNSTIPEFIIRETDDPIELYSALFRYHELDGKAILDSKNELSNSDPHPLADGVADSFFKYVVQRFFSDGEFLSESKNLESCNNPLIYRDPVLFLGNRTQGFMESLSNLVESVDKIESFPDALLRIVGVEESKELKISSDNGSSPQEGNFDLGSLEKEESVDLLLTRPANKEQERVINKLEQTGSVLVQGPPGTGKSHTIANVIGHLLANGKTVLVSSHTAKALNVVREKVARPLQPLCVSVLDNDVESKAQLKESVNGIVSYLSRVDSDSLSREIEELYNRRISLKEKIENFENEALEIRKSEYTDIVVAGKGISPSKAAKYVEEASEEKMWIPGYLEQGTPLPLSEEELRELYGTNEIISQDEERCLEEGLIDKDDLFNPIEFNELVKSYQKVESSFLEDYQVYWHSNSQTIDGLEKILDSLKECSSIISANKWLSSIFEDSQLGEEHLESWRKLIELIEETTAKVATRKEIILEYGPCLDFNWSNEHVEAVRDLVERFNDGKSISYFSKLFNSSLKEILKNSSVEERPPKNTEHFKSILALMETDILRKKLRNRWNRQMVPIGCKELGESSPEIEAKKDVEALKFATNWKEDVWSAIESSLKSLGFDLEFAFQQHSLEKNVNSHLERLLNIIDGVIIPSVESRIFWIRKNVLETKKQAVLEKISLESNKPASFNFFLKDLRDGILSHEIDRYKKAYDSLILLSSKKDIYEVRVNLLEKLGNIAPGWAAAIGDREGVHGGKSLPGDLASAWELRQWSQELDERLSKDYAEVQRNIKHSKDELQKINASYVEKMAWREQLNRTGLKERQALTGWQQLQNKLTKSGRGKLDNVRKKEARKLLKKCKDAVPVWIMPLARVFESFDLVNTKFDVIILDEASQSDITSLVAFAIAKKVIIVGDKEQVTPDAVGQELGKVQALIDELLQDIPNKMLYDGKTSVYDIAEQSFGETIRLVEHFRCVPSIIQFSNFLSYNGEIKPLREASDSPYSEHLVLHRVEAADYRGKVNQIEAIEIASIVCAMIQTDEYKNASIGVMSLVGHQQAFYIDNILQHRLTPDEYSKHKVLCGNPSQFQGDERDVVLLSMVDICDDPPLRIVQSEQYKKRYNVAVSRAKNQLWVVHSLNPDIDLKPGDLRLRLIQHALDPNSKSNALESAQREAESPFEKLVIRDLINEGYRLKPQWAVGAYRIDIVVEGQNKRVAVECDGDRYHPQEKLYDDIQRQMVLERLGWTFIRIRGSEYYRSPAKAMKRVISELEDLGIERLGPSTVINNEQDSDLRRRIISKACEIKKEWDANPISEDRKSKANTWGFRKNVLDKKESPRNRTEGNAAIKVDIAVESENIESRQKILERVARNFTSPDHDVRAVDSQEIYNLEDLKGDFSLEKLISKIPSSDWFEICKNESLNSFEKRLAYSVGKIVQNSEVPSPKQAIWASKALNKLIEKKVYSANWFYENTGIQYSEFVEILKSIQDQ